MRSYAPAAMAAITAGTAVFHGAVAFYTEPEPFFIWGGEGDIALPSQTEAGEFDTYLGTGYRGLMVATGGQIGGGEQHIELSLSGVDPVLAAEIDPLLMRRCSAVIWRTIWDQGGANLLDAVVHARGRVQKMPIEDTPAGMATIKVQVETAASGSGRMTRRMRTDPDQRLIKSTDGSFIRVGFLASKILYWGGQIPVHAGGLSNAQIISGAIHAVFGRQGSV